MVSEDPPVPIGSGLTTARGTAVGAGQWSGRRRRWPRRLAYVFLIGYALLMFVPFAWSVITSFKTLPDSVQLTIIPDPFTLDA